VKQVARILSVFQKVKISQAPAATGQVQILREWA